MKLELQKLYESYHGMLTKDEILNWAKENGEVIEVDTKKDIKLLPLGEFLGSGNESKAVFKNGDYVYKVYHGTYTDDEPFKDLKILITNFQLYFPESKYTLEKVVHVKDEDVFYPIVRQKAVQKTFKQLDIDSLSPSIKKNINQIMLKKGYKPVKQNEKIFGLRFSPLNGEGPDITDIKPRNIGIDEDGSLRIFDVIFDYEDDY